MRSVLTVLTTVLLLAAMPLTAAAADTTGLKTVTLKVENMTCSACPITVRKSLEKVPGVTKAKADFETKTATVTFDPTKTKVADLTHATTEAGYPSALAR
jgi:periplasmic mercuric ion binding protein